MEGGSVCVLVCVWENTRDVVTQCSVHWLIVAVHAGLHFWVDWSHSTRANTRWKRVELSTTKNCETPRTTYTHCRNTVTHHTHRSTSPPPLLEDLPASCCQSQGKMGFVGFVKPTDKTPLETSGLQQHKPQPYPLCRTGNLFSILPACITVLCTIEQQLSRKLS